MAHKYMMEKITTSTIGLAIMILVIALNYNVTIDTYYCANEPDKLQECTGGLSAIGKYGYSTRCYLNTDKSSYDYCSTGWKHALDYVERAVYSIETKTIINYIQIDNTSPNILSVNKVGDKYIIKVNGTTQFYTNQRTLIKENTKHGLLNRISSTKDGTINIIRLNASELSRLYLGNETTIIEIQEESKIIYNISEHNITYSLLLQKWNNTGNETWKSTPNDIYIITNNDTYKFGAIDNSTNGTILKYRYIVNSSKPLLQQSDHIWGSEYNINGTKYAEMIDFTDLNAHMSSIGLSNEVIYTYDNNILYVEFYSNGLIDPTLSNQSSTSGEYNNDIISDTFIYNCDDDSSCSNQWRTNSTMQWYIDANNTSFPNQTTLSVESDRITLLDITNASNVKFWKSITGSFDETYMLNGMLFATNTSGNYIYDFTANATSFTANGSARNTVDWSSTAYVYSNSTGFCYQPSVFNGYTFACQNFTSVGYTDVIQDLSINNDTIAVSSENLLQLVSINQLSINQSSTTNYMGEGVVNGSLITHSSGDKLDFTPGGLTNQNASGMTYMAWVYMNIDPSVSTSMSAGGCAFSTGATTYSSGGLKVLSQKPSFIIYDGASYQTISSVNTILGRQWYHITGTLDPTTGNISVFTNGVFEATKNVGNVLDNGSTCYIGRNSRFNNLNTWDGAIDEFVIYNRTLSNAEILSAYDLGVSGLENNITTDRVHYYKLDTDGVDTMGGTTGVFSGDAVTAISNIEGYAHFIKGASFLSDDVKLMVGTYDNDGRSGMTLINISNNEQIFNSTGNGVRLDGLNDYLQINDDSSLAIGASDISSCVWLNKDTDASSSFAELIRQYDTTGNQRSWVFRLNAGGSDSKLIFVTSDNGIGAKNTQSVSTNITANTWNHICFTKTGTATNFYLNGEIIGDDGTSVDPSLHDSTAKMYIGSASASATFIAGIFDDVILYKRLLSADEINTTYQRGLLNLANNLSTTNLIGYWDFDGTFTDSSTSNNDISIGNEAYISNGIIPVNSNPLIDYRINSVSSSNQANGVDYWFVGTDLGTTLGNNTVIPSFIPSAPNVTFISPVSSSCQQSPIITYNVSDIDGGLLNCTLYADYTTNPTTILQTNLSINGSVTTTLTSSWTNTTDGIVYHYMSCTDGGLTTNTTISNFTNDYASPVVTVGTAITPSPIGSTSTGTCKITATDSCVLKANQTWYVNGIEKQNDLVNTLTTGVEYTFDTIDSNNYTKDDILSCNVTLYDEFDQTTTNNTQLTVQGVTPIVSLVSPSNETLFNSDNISFVINASDMDNDTLTCSLLVDDTPSPTTVRDTVNVTGTVISQLVNLNADNLNYSTYYWTANCTDPEGLQATASPELQFDTQFLIPSIVSSNIGITSINWTWTVPLNTEASSYNVMVGTININTSNLYYNAISLTSGTSYTVNVTPINDRGILGTLIANTSSTYSTTSTISPCICTTYGSTVCYYNGFLEDERTCQNCSDEGCSIWGI